MARHFSSSKVIYAALAGNLLVATTKFAAAWWTDSSVMFSEGVHSLVDTANQALLLYGLRRAALPPDRERPLGYGRELYFWSFIVALLMFTLGAGVSLVQGIFHIREPVPIEDAYVNYIVLAFSALFEGTSWFIALREFRALKGSLGYLEAAERSKDPTSFMVLFEDSAALAGLAIAALGTFASVHFALPALDGAASIGIAGVLGITAWLLARESKGLLMGESAVAGVNASILKITREHPGVESANGLFTVHIGPQQIVGGLSIEFRDGLTTENIEVKVREIEEKIRRAHPDVIALFVKPQTREAAREPQLIALDDTG